MDLNESHPDLPVNPEGFDALVFAYFDHVLDAESEQLLIRCLREQRYVRRFVEICRQEQLVYELITMETQTSAHALETGEAVESTEGVLNWCELADYERIAPAIEIPEEKHPRHPIDKVVYPPRTRRMISRFSIATLSMAAAAMIFLAVLIHVEPQADPNPPGPSLKTATPAGRNWQLVWSDEFDSGSSPASPNSANWG